MFTTPFFGAMLHDVLLSAALRTHKHDPRGGPQRPALSVA